MAKTTKDRIIDSLEDLGESLFKRFKTKLCDRKQEPRIRKGVIEKADTLDLADKLVSVYTESGAVQITVEILESIGCAQEASDLKQSIKDKHFIDQHRTTLIDRVCQVEPILDRLLDKGIITNESYSNITAESTQQKKMRYLLQGPVNAGGNRAKDELYAVLLGLEPYLMEELQKQ